MRPIENLKPETQARLRGRNLIVFDGECVLCSGFFRFVYTHDTANRFSFTTAQSDLGQQLYRDLGLPTDDFETNLVIVDGVIHERMQAFAAAMGALPAPWRWLRVLRYLPAVIADPMYHAVARNRYRIFGRRDTCMMPDTTLRMRFVA